MTERPYRNVYILGAGFSYAMGGPLFTELLTHGMTARCNSLERSGGNSLQHPLDGMYERIAHVFERLSGTSYPKMNAEQFLERCDAAANGRQVDFAKELLAQIPTISNYVEQFAASDDFSQPMTHFVRLLKLRLAIETSAFLQEHIDDSERWDPYVEWFTQLTKDDVIITTNYDRLIEEIATRCGTSYPTDDEPMPVKFHFECMLQEAKNPILCKLHGSADWILSGGNAYVQPAGATFPDWDKEVLLGVPGSSKIALEEGVLRDIWNYAFEAIQDAEFVSIVGYSMPESDNRLRMRLLKAIASNRISLRRVNIVLGGRSERGERAKMILEQAVRTRMFSDNYKGFFPHVHLLPIYAQDYLPRFVPRSEKELLQTQFAE